MPRREREMMDVHVLTSRGAELVVQVVDGQVIVPPPAPAAVPAQPAPGK